MYPPMQIRPDDLKRYGFQVLTDNPRRARHSRMEIFRDLCDACGLWTNTPFVGKECKDCVRRKREKKRA